MPEGAWCVRHHGRGHQEKPEQESRDDAWRKHHRHDHQQFDKDEHSSDFPAELGVVPQFDPEQAQSRNQHQQGPGHGVRAIADEPDACEHNPDQMQRAQGDAQPASPGKISVASHKCNQPIDFVP